MKQKGFTLIKLLVVIAIIFILIGLTSACVTAKSQPSPPQPQLPVQDAEKPDQWRTYLQGENVGALAIEGSVVWAGTENGLVRLDVATGKQVRYLENVFIWAVTVDHHGAKWLATMDSVRRYDGRSWEIYRPQDLGVEDVPRWMPGEEELGEGEWALSHVALAVDLKGQVWAALNFSNGDMAPGGVSLFDGHEWTRPAINREFLGCVEAIAVDHDGHIWLASSDSAVLREFDGTRWLDHTKPFRQPYVTESGHISEESFILNGPCGVTVDGRGHVWCGLSDGLAEFDGNAWTTHASPGGTVLTADRKNRVWLATDGGAVRFDGHLWEMFTTKNGMADNEVRAIVVDDVGRIWFGTANGVSVVEG